MKGKAFTISRPWRPDYIKPHCVYNINGGGMYASDWIEKELGIVIEPGKAKIFQLVEVDGAWTNSEWGTR